MEISRSSSEGKIVIFKMGKESTDEARARSVYYTLDMPISTMSSHEIELKKLIDLAQKYIDKNVLKVREYFKTGDTVTWLSIVRVELKAIITVLGLARRSGCEEDDTAIEELKPLISSLQKQYGIINALFQVFELQ
jgi:hypothetical protein